jgi:hypothetical protein
MRIGRYRRALDAAAVMEIKTRYREGAGLVELAHQFGVSRQAIWSLLRRRGVETRPRHGRRVQVATNAERDMAGVIVTVREQTTGVMRTLHVAGKAGDALRTVCARVDAWDGDWRVVCYSTPQTVLGDLQGARARFGAGQGGHVDCPEATMLARIGRIDLLDPALDHGHPGRGSRR